MVLLFPGLIIRAINLICKSGKVSTAETTQTVEAGTVRWTMAQSKASTVCLKLYAIDIDSGRWGPRKLRDQFCLSACALQSGTHTMKQERKQSMQSQKDTPFLFARLVGVEHLVPVLLGRKVRSDSRFSTSRRFVDSTSKCLGTLTPFRESELYVVERAQYCQPEPSRDNL